MSDSFDDEDNEKNKDLIIMRSESSMESSMVSESDYSNPSNGKYYS
jgi:hypothetical protein